VSEFLLTINIWDNIGHYVNKYYTSKKNRRPTSVYLSIPIVTASYKASNK